MAAAVRATGARLVNPRHGSLVLAANVYISEGRCEATIRSLEERARSVPGTALLNVFVDKPYNRTGFTITSLLPDKLCEAAVSVAVSAIQQVDLRSHVATHPRLGVADHISVHPVAWTRQQQQQEQEQEQSGPLRAAGLAEAAACALSIGRQLSTRCPVYFYGAAHPDGKRLAEIRRGLGYFKPDASQAGASQWQGALGMTSLSHFPPDAGLHEVSPSTGVATIGAVPFIINYNVPVLVSDMTQARALARAVSERGGGLPSVEAMALNHDGVIEVACNLLDPGVSTPEAVQQLLERLCKAAGVGLRPGYMTGRSPEELTRMTLDAVGPSAM